MQNTSLNLTEITVLRRSLSSTDYITITLLVMLVPCIIIGNVFVIFSFFFKVGRRMCNVTNYFIVNLAMSDILVGMFSVPFWIFVQITRSGLLSTALLVFMALDIMCGVASIVNLMIISIERAFAVFLPADHRNLSQKRPLIFGAVCLVWLFAFINAGLYYTKTFFGWVDYTIYIVCVGFGLPTLIIVGSYVVIFKVARRQMSREQRIRKEVRLASMVAIVIVLFIFCWLPFFLVNILYVYCECKVKTIRQLIPFVKILHYSNSMMNPVVYAYTNSDYRQAFKNLWFAFFKIKKRRQSSVASQSAITSLRIRVS